jgi:hypothetical protein
MTEPKRGSHQKWNKTALMMKHQSWIACFSHLDELSSYTSTAVSPAAMSDVEMTAQCEHR